MGRAPAHRLTDPFEDIQRAKQAFMPAPDPSRPNTSRPSPSAGAFWFWALTGMIAGVALIRWPKLRRAAWPWVSSYIWKRLV